MAAGLVSGMLINRALAPAGRGALAEMQSWAALFAVVFGLSLDSAIYHIADRRQYPQAVADKFITTLGLIGASILLAIAGFFVFIWVAPDMFSTRSLPLIGGAVMLLAAMLAASTLTVFFQGEGEVPFVAQAAMIQTGLYVALVILAYLLSWLTISIALWLAAVGQALLFLLTFAGARRRSMLRGVFRPALARVMLGSGAKLHLATVATFLYTKVNQLLVNHYAGDHEAGLFAVALNLAVTSALVPQTLQNVLYPRVIHAQDEVEVTAHSMRLTLYGWGVCTLVLMLLARPILLIYGGEKFLPAVPAFRLCLAAMLFLTLSSMLGPLFIKRGAFVIAMLMSVTLGAVSLGINFLLVPQAGALGAALATALTTALGFLGSLVFFRHLSGRNPLVIFAFRPREFLPARMRTDVSDQETP